MKEEVNIAFQDEGDKRIIKMPKTIDIKYHIYIKGRVIELLKSTNKHIVIDMEETDFIDSSGISIIIMIYNLLMNEERKLFILNANGNVREAFEIAKLQKYIEIL